MRPFEVDGDQLVEALFARFENIAPLALGDAGVVHQQVKARKTLPRVADQRFAIGRRGDVAAEDIRAGLGAKALGGVAAAAVGPDNLMSFGKLDGDGPPNAAAGAGDQARHRRAVIF